MKKLSLVLVLFFVAAMTSMAFGADSATITVQASVMGTCKFSPVGASGTLDFGTLDPGVGVDVNANTTIQFWCTKGVTLETFTVGNGNYFSGGSNNMRDTVSGDDIPYLISAAKDANPNQGPISPRTLTISGSVLGVDYINKSAGNYSDTVIIDVTP